MCFFFVTLGLTLAPWLIATLDHPIALVWSITCWYVPFFICLIDYNILLYDNPTLCSLSSLWVKPSALAYRDTGPPYRDFAVHHLLVRFIRLVIQRQRNKSLTLAHAQTLLYASN